MRKLWPIIVIILALTNTVPAQITVATAANMQFAMEDIKDAFKAEAGQDVKSVYGASGKLTTQIRNGAPFDVFISADMSYPDSLFKWKYASDKPRVYAYGILVMWTMEDYDLAKGLSILTDSAVAKIAVGDLKATIYGPAAVKAMTASKVYDAVKSKLVFGENITQVARYITTLSADIGFSAKSIAMSSQMAGKGKWVEVDKSLYEPLAQGAAVLKYGLDNNPKLSKAFFAFLYGKQGREILGKYGYILPGEGAPKAP